MSNRLFDYVKTRLKFIVDSPKTALVALLLKAPRLWPDKIYLRLKYYEFFGKPLNLNPPRTFNEKTQWLKLYDRNPAYVELVDKYAVKDFIARTIGDKYVIPTLGMWTSSKEIDFDKLPDKFVLKTTHDSGSVFVCTDKTKFDIAGTCRKLDKALKSNFYYSLREWPYKMVPPRIIAEEYLEDEYGELRDYKFYCFNGKVHYVLVCIDRPTDLKYYYFDLDWNFLVYNRYALNVPGDFTLPKPENLDEMVAIAERYAKDFSFLRVDFYNVRGHIYFGEFTLYDSAGFELNILPETDVLFGDLITLPKKRTSGK